MMQKYSSLCPFANSFGHMFFLLTNSKPRTVGLKSKLLQTALSINQEY